ncbi:SH3 domain-containing protein, partial [Flavobacterium filum]
MYGICNLAIIPLRVEPNDRSEQVSQVLFGEHFTIIEQQKQWLKIQLHYDQYEGWIDSKQCQIITQNEFDEISKSSIILNNDLV